MRNTYVLLAMKEDGWQLDAQQARELLKKDISGQLFKRWVLCHIPFIALVIFGAIRFFYFSDISLNLGLPASTVTTQSLVPPIFTGVLTACSIMVGFFTITAYNLRHDFDTYIDQCKNELRNSIEAKKESNQIILSINVFSHEMEHVTKFLMYYFIVFFFNLIIYTFIFMFSDVSQLFVTLLFPYAVLFLYSVSFGLFLFLYEFMHYPEHDHVC